MEIPIQIAYLILVISSLITITLITLSIIYINCGGRNNRAYFCKSSGGDTVPSGGLPPSGGVPSGIPPSGGGGVPSGIPPSGGGGVPSGIPPSGGEGSSPDGGDPDIGPAATIPDSAPQSANPISDDTIMGFWKGYAASCKVSEGYFNNSAWFFAFPGYWGTNISDVCKNQSGVYGNPDYSQNILTIGGGGTDWGDSLYTTLQNTIPSWKEEGWTGICLDWEVISTDHTDEGFNTLLAAIKNAGLLCIITTTANGPYQGADGKTFSLDWNNVDFVIPQLYGGSGITTDEYINYMDYWLTGSNPTGGVHNITFDSPLPIDKLLWGVTQEGIAMVQTHIENNYPSISIRGYVLWCVNGECY